VKSVPKKAPHLAASEAARGDEPRSLVVIAVTLGALLAVVAMTSWQQTAVGTALPQMLDSLRSSANYTEVVSAYLAGFAIAAPFAPLLTPRPPLRVILPLAFGNFLEFV
jgi:hypothetical protein